MLDIVPRVKEGEKERKGGRGREREGERERVKDKEFCKAFQLIGQAIGCTCNPIIS